MLPLILLLPTKPPAPPEPLSIMNSTFPEAFESAMVLVFKPTNPPSHALPPLVVDRIPELGTIFPVAMDD